MSAFVVDANVMNLFQSERQKGTQEVVHCALDAVFKCGHIALDEGGLCQQEWLDCAAGTAPLALSDWINDCLVAQRILLYALGGTPGRKLLINLGMPQKDHKWVKLAHSCSARAIVTQDIDFVDCTKKKADASAKQKIREKGTGPTQKWIKNNTGADVWLVERVPELCEAA